MQPGQHPPHTPFPQTACASEGEGAAGGAGLPMVCPLLGRDPQAPPSTLTEVLRVSGGSLWLVRPTGGSSPSFLWVAEKNPHPSRLGPGTGQCARRAPAAHSLVPTTSCKAPGGRRVPGGGGGTGVTSGQVSLMGVGRGTTGGGVGPGQGGLLPRPTQVPHEKPRTGGHTPENHGEHLHSLNTSFIWQRPFQKGFPEGAGHSLVQFEITQYPSYT